MTEPIDLSKFEEPTTTEEPANDPVTERLDRIEYLLEQLIEKVSDLSYMSGSGYSVEDIADFDS